MRTGRVGMAGVRARDVVREVPTQAYPQRSSSGQMAVELAVLMPVIIVVSLTVYNLARFVALCATFDRVSLDMVLWQGVSPAGGSGGLPAVDEVRRCIAGALNAPQPCEVQVSAERLVSSSSGVLTTSPLLTRFRCVLVFRPWPSSFVIAGVPYRSPLVLRHERSLVVDCYRSGVVA